MDEPQLPFGFEEPDSPWVKVYYPEWGLVCPTCDAVEEKMAEEHAKMLGTYQEVAQNLAGLRVKALQSKTRRSTRKSQARMMRLLKIVNKVRKEAYLLEELMYESRDHKTVCLSCYGKKCITEEQMF